MKVSFISKMFTVVLYVLFVAGSVTIASLLVYMVMHGAEIFNWSNFINELNVFLCFFVVIVGGLLIWMIGEVIGAMKTLRKDPFTRRNVNAVTHIGIIVILLFIAFVIKTIMFFTVLTALCAVILFAASLAVFTLQNLFSQAIIYKEENELTI